MVSGSKSRNSYTPRVLNVPPQTFVGSRGLYSSSIGLPDGPQTGTKYFTYIGQFNFSNTAVSEVATIFIPILQRKKLAQRGQVTCLDLHSLVKVQSWDLNQTVWDQSLCFYHSLYFAFYQTRTEIVIKNNTGNIYYIFKCIDIFELTLLIKYSTYFFSNPRRRLCSCAARNYYDERL